MGASLESLKIKGANIWGLNVLVAVDEPWKQLRACAHVLERCDGCACQEADPTAAQRNQPAGGLEALYGDKGKAASHVNPEDRETLFAGKIDPHDPRLHLRGAKSPKAKNRAIEKKRAVFSERAEHKRTLRRVLDFAECGSEEERKQALRLALGIGESRKKERQEMQQEKETAAEFEDSQLLGAARLERARVEQDEWDAAENDELHREEQQDEQAYQSKKSTSPFSFLPFGRPAESRTTGASGRDARGAGALRRGVFVWCLV